MGKLDDAIFDEELIALTGVDIRDGEKKCRDLYDFFVDLAKAWESLESDIARSRVAEILMAEGIKGAEGDG